MEAAASTVTPFVYSSSTYSHELALILASCFDMNLSLYNDTSQTYPVWKIDKMSSICTTISYVQSVPLLVALVTGLTGNILALLTMLQFPRTPATFYMSLLAASDWMSLATKAIHITMHSLYLHGNWSCRLLNTLTNFTAIYANWALVLICFERLVTILFPLKKGYYFTLRRAYISAVVLGVVIFLFCSPTLINYVYANHACVYIDADFGHSWNQVQSTLYCYLPSSLMIVMVFIIWRAFSIVQRNRILVFCGDEGAGANTLTERRLQDQARTERSITVMLLFSSVVFIVLTVPFCVMMLVNWIVICEPLTITCAYLLLAYFIANALVQLSHAVNFFVYFVSTKGFRLHLRKLLRCPPLERNKSKLDRTEHTMVDLL